MIEPDADTMRRRASASHDSGPDGYGPLSFDGPELVFLSPIYDQPKFDGTEESS